MWLKWNACVSLIILLVYLNEVQSKRFFSSSRSSSSKNSGSRKTGSSGSSHSIGSHNTGSSHNSATHGNYGWVKTTSKPSNYFRTTRRHYPVTTMPTRRHVVTTRKHYPVTTRPTQRHTTTRKRYVMTTMSSVRTTHHTKQPPYNPFFTSKPNQNLGSNSRTTKQPPYNPFFTQSHKNNGSNFNNFGHTTPKSVFGQNNKYNGSNFNNFGHTTPKSVFGQNNRHNGSNFNNFGHTTPKSVFGQNNKYNGSNFNNFGHTTPKSVFGQNNRHNGSNFNNFGHTTPKSVFGQNNKHNGSNFNNLHNNGTLGVNTQKPFLQHTTKIVPVGSGTNAFGRQNNTKPIQTNNNNWNHTARPPYTTHKPIYQGPSYNTSSLNHGSKFNHGSSGGIYQPPSARKNNTYNTGSGLHTNYPIHPPVQPQTTTIINNNHNHYYGGSSSYYRPGYYTPSGTTNTHVTIINNHNHHIIPPTRHYYSYGPPAVGVTVLNTHYYPTNYHTTYHYSSYDTGSTSLGFFIGYQLGRISRPSYYYHSTSYVNNDYVPRYDHYTIHYHNYNSANIPREAPIQPNAIVVCAGDSGNLCPPGNMPLCTNNGAVMCVVNAISASPCSNDKSTDCVKTAIPCEGNTSPECKQKTTADISIPCVSKASIPAGVGLVNNSIVVTDANDSTIKSFCVTVIALPSKNETKTEKRTNPEPPFQYTTNYTGVDLLGYYLGDKLQKLELPSYSFLNYDENYNPVEKFDHYNIFHYYHDANVLPNRVDIKSEQILNCAGDSGTFCPQFTVSLCLNDGAVVCVADNSSTTFSSELQTNYLNSSVACRTLKSPACKSDPNITLPIQIPCISSANIFANISFMIRNFGSGNETQFYRTIELTNSTANGTGQNVTTPREMCVAVLALPGEKNVLPQTKNRKITGVVNTTEFLNLPKFTYKDSGSSVLGTYLDYKLGTLYYPSYYYINAYLYFQSGTIQKYDHFSVHHYYKGKEIIPDYLEFQAFDLRACEGDSGLICPLNTTAICLNDGGVMCLTDNLLTLPCLKRKNTTCVKTILTCKNNKPCDKVINAKKISIPCISTATIYGDIMAVNNSIYKKIPAAAKSYTDLQPIPGINVNNTPVYHKAQQFCVTIVALPAERLISDGEKVVESLDSLFGKLASKIFS